MFQAKIVTQKSVYFRAELRLLKVINFIRIFSLLQLMQSFRRQVHAVLNSSSDNSWRNHQNLSGSFCDLLYDVKIIFYFIEY